MQNRFSRTLVVIMSMVLALLSACGGEEQAAATATVLRPVKTTVVTSGDVFIGREFTGVVDAIQVAELGFQVAGKLQELNVREGDQVIAGQLIAQLDQTDFRLRVESSQVDYDRAEADFKRGEQLVRDGHISRSDYDNLRANYNAANTQLKSAWQNFEYTSLRAPFAGLIAERHVENFENVKAQQNIVTLQDLSALVIRVDIPESIMIGIDPENPNRRIYATFEALGDTQFPLTVKEASTRADPQTQTFRITLTMPAPAGRNILPGMTANVVGGPVDAAAATVTLPPQSVLEDAGGRFVYIAEPQAGDEAVIARRAVTTGRLLDQGLEVLSGLAEGDHVVSAGMSKIQPGMRVRLLPQN